MLNIAFQMDPLESVNIRTDSTYLLALCAQQRGHQLYHYLPSNLTLQQNHLFTQAHPFTINTHSQPLFLTQEVQRLDLHTVDVILMRQDPPFDLAYITATYLLEHLMSDVLVINDPIQVRNAPEKLLVTSFPECMPPSIITRNIAEAEAFRREYHDIILKPLYGSGGNQVFYVKHHDTNFYALLELFLSNSKEPFIVQKYLPEIANGDKRIILFDGIPVGAVNRMLSQGESRANFHAGGTPKAAIITENDRRICERIGSVLQERNLLFAGIDIIGPYLTEINVTSPTCLQEINRLNNVKLEESLLDLIEEKVQQKKYPSTTTHTTHQTNTLHN